MTDAQLADARAGQSVRMAVSNAMVKLYEEHFGRGPTKAQTHFAGPDTLVCTLQDSLTPAERSLVRMGEHQRLRDVRMFFQYAPRRSSEGRSRRSRAAGSGRS